MPEPEYLTIDELTLEEIKRLSSKIIVDPQTDCWTWIAYCQPDGYGTFAFRGHTELAHRVVYAWIRNPLPRGKGGIELDHLCRHRDCVNPSHLEEVLPLINLQRRKTHCRKTHCKRNHPYAKSVDLLKRQRCFLCRRFCQPPTYHRDYMRQYRARKKAETKARLVSSERRLT